MMYFLLVTFGVEIEQNLSCGSRYRAFIQWKRYTWRCTIVYRCVKYIYWIGDIGQTSILPPLFCWGPIGQTVTISSPKRSKPIRPFRTLHHGKIPRARRSDRQRQVSVEELSAVMCFGDRWARMCGCLEVRHVIEGSDVSPPAKSLPAYQPTSSMSV